MADRHEEDSLLRKRFCELAERASDRGCFLFSDFLGLSEQAVFHEAKTTFCRGAKYTLSGGAEGCERQMVRFGDAEELGYELPFPIVILKIEPKSQKFADALTHRDFLGALMNLGIDRAMLGDIVLRDNAGYLFAQEQIAPFIAQELKKVKHTDVTVTPCEELPEGDLYKTKPVEIRAVGERIDAIVAKVFSLSRDESLTLFKKRLVFLDGKEVANNSAIPKEGEIISVRGYGRMIYRGCRSLSKKGKMNIVVDIFV